MLIQLAALFLNLVLVLVFGTIMLPVNLSDLGCKWQVGHTLANFAPIQIPFNYSKGTDLKKQIHKHQEETVWTCMQQYEAWKAVGQVVVGSAVPRQWVVLRATDPGRRIPATPQ